MIDDYKETFFRLEQKLIICLGAVAEPTGFQSEYTDPSGDVSFWQLKCPTNYDALGYAVQYPSIHKKEIKCFIMGHKGIANKGNNGKSEQTKETSA